MQAVWYYDMTGMAAPIHQPFVDAMLARDPGGAGAAIGRLVQSTPRDVDALTLNTAGRPRRQG